MKQQHSKEAQNINELEFRIHFRSEFGVDYLEALDQLNNDKKETERKWNQTLTKYGLTAS